jgi:hypothetical protein
MKNVEKAEKKAASTMERSAPEKIDRLTFTITALPQEGLLSKKANENRKIRQRCYISCFSPMFSFFPIFFII